MKENDKKLPSPDKKDNPESSGLTGSSVIVACIGAVAGLAVIVLVVKRSRNSVIKARDSGMSFVEMKESESSTAIEPVQSANML